MARLRGILTALAILAAPAATTFAAEPPLTADGWGDLRIGMTEAEAVRRFHLAIPSDDEVYSAACREMPVPEGGPGFFVMTEAGRVTRITLYAESRLTTDHGIGIGSPESEVRRGYGRAIEAVTHIYEGEPALYMTVWNADRRRGVRYETDSRRQVTAIHVGESITYIEGCL